MTVKVERIEAADESGDFALVTRDDDKVVEIQEYDQQGQLVRRSYGDALGAE